MDEQVREALSAYLDGELDGPEKEKLETAMDADPRLRAELEDLRRTAARLSSLNSTETVAPPAEWRRQLMARVQAEGAAPGDSAKDSYGIIEWLRGVRWRIWGPVLAGALVLMFAVAGIRFPSFGAGSSGGSSAFLEGSSGGSAIMPEMAREEVYTLRDEMGGSNFAAGQSAPAPDVSRETAEAAAGAAAASTAADGDLETAPVRRQMVRHADVTLVVDDFAQGSGYLRRRTDQAGGYIADEETSQWDGVWRGSFQIRLPAEELDSFLTALEDVGSLENRRLYSEDVTMEYVDVQSRIRMMRVKEDRLLELVAQSGDLADLLTVERELAATRGELESLEGRMRYLSNQVEYSTLQLQLRQKTVSTSVIQGTGLWQVLERFREAFVASVNRLLILLGNFVVWIGQVLPYLVSLALIFGLAGFAARRFLLKRKRKAEKNG
jgi:anti-sigma factor RsiW